MIESDEHRLKQQQEWLRVMPSIKAAIKEGYFDADLKSVTKELLARAKRIGVYEGRTQVESVSQLQAARASRPGSLPPTWEKNANGKPVKGTLTTTIVRLPESKALDQANTDVINFEDRYYPRSQIIGKAVMIPHDVKHKWAGRWVHVTGWGPQSAKVEPLSAKDRDGMTLPVAGEQGFVPHRVFKSYFG